MFLNYVATLQKVFTTHFCVATHHLNNKVIYDQNGILFIIHNAWSQSTNREPPTENKTMSKALSHGKVIFVMWWSQPFPHGYIYGHAVLIPHREGRVKSETPLCINQNPVCKLNKFSIAHTMLITLYFPMNYVHSNLGCFPIIIVQKVCFKYS